jgi:hypothetical protein
MTAEPKKLKPLDTTAEAEDLATPIPDDHKTISEQLDAEEAEFRAIRRDLPGVKGASSAGIVAISVGKTPTKNEFFRTHPEFRPIVPIVAAEFIMEKQFFAVTSDMVEALNAIGITVSDHTLYLTITSPGAIRIVPVRQANADGEQNEYDRTRKLAWWRLSMDGGACSLIRKTTATRCFLLRLDGTASRNGRI